MNSLNHFLGFSTSFSENDALATLASMEAQDDKAKLQMLIDNGAEECFTMPIPSSRVMCVYCFETRYNHIFNNKSHLALCSKAPDSVREDFALLVVDKKSLTCGESSKQQIRELAERSRARQGSTASYVY
jgi:hypothetical protein